MINMKGKIMSNQIVTISFNTGSDCKGPEKYKNVTSKSQLFASMLKDGYTPYKISVITGVKYQQVRNQLISSGLWKFRK